MILKIISNNSIQKKSVSINKVLYSPTFNGKNTKVDTFIKGTVNKEIPLTLQDALSKIGNLIADKKFKKVDIPLLEDEDPLIELKNLVLSAEKIKNEGFEKILVEICYDNVDNSGSYLFANNTKDKVLEEIKNPDLINKIIMKLRYLSDKLYEEPEVIDLRG